jgi:hypothetical protein
MIWSLSYLRGVSKLRSGKAESEDIACACNAPSVRARADLDAALELVAAAEHGLADATDATLSLDRRCDLSAPRQERILRMKGLTHDSLIVVEADDKEGFVNDGEAGGIVLVASE